MKPGEELQWAIGYLGKVDNASGQICNLDSNGEPTLLLFEFGCPNCSEVAGKNANDYGEALAVIVNAAPALYDACKAAIDFYAWHMAATPSEVLEELTDRRIAIQEQLHKAIS